MSTVTIICSKCQKNLQLTMDEQYRPGSFGYAVEDAADDLDWHRVEIGEVDSVSGPVAGLCPSCYKTLAWDDITDDELGWSEDVAINALHNTLGQTVTLKKRGEIIATGTLVQPDNGYVDCFAVQVLGEWSHCANVPFWVSEIEDNKREAGDRFPVINVSELG